MLGSGRPFLVEIQNARHLPCDEDVKNIEEKINNLENKLVSSVLHKYSCFSITYCCKSEYCVCRLG